MGEGECALYNQEAWEEDGKGAMRVFAEMKGEGVHDSCVEVKGVGVCATIVWR